MQMNSLTAAVLGLSIIAAGSASRLAAADTPAEAQVRRVVDRWFQAWSPGADPWDGQAMREIFRAGDGAITVVDDMGGTALTLDSVDEYISTWTPFMQRFSYWSVAPVGPVRVMADDKLAVATFTFAVTARDAQGAPVNPAPGQHGTLVLVKDGDGWRIVREHLTTYAQPNGQ
jgi:ketosteroid isomerase-like protein